MERLGIPGTPALTAERGYVGPARIGFGEQVHELHHGTTREFPLDERIA